MPLQSEKVKTGGADTRALYFPALTLSLNLFIFGPAVVLFGNPGEFLVGGEDVVLQLLPGFLVTFFALYAAGILVARRSGQLAYAALFLPALMTYLHGNLLRWETGVLDGTALQLGRFWPFSADILLWILLGLLVWRFRAWLALSGWGICLALIVFQLAGAVTLKRNEEGYHAELKAIPEDLLSLHQGLNVVHLVLDGFQGSTFETLLDNDPTFSESLDGFMFFRDTLATSDITYLSLPASLSGLVFENKQSITDYWNEALGKGSLYGLMANNGFEIDVASPVWWNGNRTEFTSYYRIPLPYANHAQARRSAAWLLLDLSIFRQAPYPFKPLVYRNGNWLLSGAVLDRPETQFPHFSHSDFLLDLADGFTVGRDRPAYKLIHVLSPHAPLVSRPDCGFAGRELPIGAVNFQRQSRCIMATVGNFLRKLKRIGVYDQSLILIHADHGADIPFKMSGERNPDTGWIGFEGLGNALPLLLVKPPGRSGALEVSERPVSLRDIPATVSGLLGMEAALPGRSVFSVLPPVAPRPYFTSPVHRNEAAERDQFDEFWIYTVNGSLYDRSAWQVERKTLEAQ